MSQIRENGEVKPFPCSKSATKKLISLDGAAVGAGLFNVTIITPAEFAEEMAKKDKNANVEMQVCQAIRKATGGSVVPDDVLRKCLHFVGS